MRTIHVTTHSRLLPEVALAAGHDFTARRAEIFPAVSIPHCDVHELDHTTADVTEGTPVGIGINWERCDYDWSQPGSVKAVVTDSMDDERHRDRRDSPKRGRAEGMSSVQLPSREVGVRGPHRLPGEAKARFYRKLTLVPMWRPVTRRGSSCPPRSVV